ncbi:hypothetical protein Asppvi_011125 [Aspergillus pseudoviridinutans]|uniref:Uncharacterized protein n=1 Tax=Aspergillus pseudoviridinutans TaxID=1517512 RepID=A0A9P3BKK3_9EURO|nr:uncharacterized protein Asppvi_011125 [Aspergillus pseudoviridinutans]GIJ92149.1 hypothetical protein Asppvi_011125 [Aspergillus pseudoviridinutans]
MRSFRAVWSPQAGVETQVSNNVGWTGVQVGPLLTTTNPSRFIHYFSGVFKVPSLAAGDPRFLNQLNAEVTGNTGEMSGMSRKPGKPGGWEKSEQIEIPTLLTMAKAKEGRLF